MDITKRIKLDFMCPPYPIVVYAKQGDVNSRYVEIEPYAYGEPYIIPDGVTAKFACKKPDGKRIVNDYPTISENIITVPLTDQTLAISGNAQAAIVLLDAEGKILTTQNFTLSIEASPYINSEIESVDEYYVVSFPAPTASDNNKILTVSDGKYIYDYIENIQSNSDYTVSSTMILDVPTMEQNATDFTETQKADVLEFAEAAKKAAGNTTILLRYSGATSPATFYYANSTYVFRAINPLCNPGDGESVEMIVVELNTRRNTLLADVHAHLGDTGEWLLEKDDDSKYVNDLSVLTTETAASLATNSLVGYAIERGLENVNSEVEVLKQQISDFLYEKIDITSFNNKIDSSSNNVNYAEIGSEISEVELSWAINKIPTKLLLDGVEIDVTAINYNLPTEETSSSFPLKSDTTYTLVATDERGNSDSMTTKIQFVKPKFYGTVKVDASIDQELLRSGSVILNGTKSCSFTASPKSDEFVFFAMPKDLGIPAFTINGWTYQWDRNEIITIELLTGELVEYRVCISDNPGGSSALHIVS